MSSPYLNPNKYGRKVKALKKIFVLTATLVLTLCFGLTVHAADTMKIRMNGEVKMAKDIGTGKGISFTLPDLTDNKFVISAIELAIFEKGEADEHYSIFEESRLIDNPESLNISMGFGDTSRFTEKAKYKITYRYFVKSLDDMSKTAVAGENIKDGWRMVGELAPTNATDSGFVFYKNTMPEIEVYGISYTAEDISGPVTLSYDESQLEGIYIHKTALADGITIDYSVSDYDSEDVLTVNYQLTDAVTSEAIAEGQLASDNKIKCTAECEYAYLVLTVTDGWNAFAQSEKLTLKIDNETPYVYSEFNDLGRVIKGGNLYSNFTVMDDQNYPLTSGNVYYSIFKDGQELYKDIRLPNNDSGEYTVDRTGMSDGVYEIELTIFDKAYNKYVHSLTQMLDNTAPTVTFLTSKDNVLATDYSTWQSKSKNIMFTAWDKYAGVRRCNYYMDYNLQGSTYLNSPMTYTFSYPVTVSKTGKLYYYFYVYDNAVTLDKVTNSVNTSASGNSRFVSQYVWLDKTPPTVTINADEDTWYNAPMTLTFAANDYESSAGTGDVSGVKSREYAITESETLPETWLSYPTSGVVFNTGGVYYFHAKAIDYAGNETVVTKKIKINEKSEIVGKVTPTSDYLYTIYNQLADETNNVYVIKNTAYNTKFQYRISDTDIQDTIRTDIHLVSCDDSSVFADVSVDTAPSGTAQRTVTFNVPYTKADKSPLPDGVYRMLLTVSEMKNDTDILTMHQNVLGCEVVIKRSALPLPQINVADGTDGKKVTIIYPDETVSGSLNAAYIRSMYKKEYKLVFEGTSNGEYLPYTDVLTGIKKDCVVTALYTDVAGNISTDVKRIYADDSDSSDDSILKDGNTVTVEEGRQANTYYIGTRRDKQKGIDKSAFDFLK